jgi:uncharacterized membrane protein
LEVSGGVIDRPVSREDIDHFAQSGVFDARGRDAALGLAGITPDSAAWNTFLSRLFLFLGALYLVAAVGFFVAYNWNDMGRFAKLGLLEAAVVIPAVLAFAFTDTMRRRAALLAGILAIGPLLAYVGQTYQTGADNYELFRAWALLALPWVLVARWRMTFAAWILIVNLSVQLYFSDVWRPLNNHWNDSAGLVALIALNAALLALLERFAAHIDGAGRVGERLAAGLMLAGATTLLLSFLFERETTRLWHLPIGIAVLGASFWGYRVLRFDLVILAFACIAGIVFCTALSGKLLSEIHMRDAAFLWSGAVAIGLSAWAGSWLRELGKQRSAA